MRKIFIFMSVCLIALFIGGCSTDTKKPQIPEAKQADTEKSNGKKIKEEGLVVSFKGHHFLLPEDFVKDTSSDQLQYKNAKKNMLVRVNYVPMPKPNVSLQEYGGFAQSTVRKMESEFDIIKTDSEKGSKYPYFVIHARLKSNPSEHVYMYSFLADDTAYIFTGLCGENDTSAPVEFEKMAKTFNTSN